VHPDPSLSHDPQRGNDYCSGGFGVAVATDGASIVVGANQTGRDATLGTMGAAYVYRRDNAGRWALTGTLFPPTGASGQINSVAVSGNRVSFATLDYSTSANDRVYTFALSAGVWQPDGQWPGTGPIALAGDALVYAEASNFYQDHVLALRQAGGWVNVQKFVQQCVVSLTGYCPRPALNNPPNRLVFDGTTLAFEIHNQPGQPTVFIDRFDGTSLQAEAALSDPTGNPGASLFGDHGLAVNDGRVVVGAPGNQNGVPGSGNVYLYTRQANGAWPLTLSLNDPVVDYGFGYRVALSQGALGASVNTLNIGWGGWFSFDAITGAATGSVNVTPGQRQGALTRFKAVEGDLAVGLAQDLTYVPGNLNGGILRVYSRTVSGWSQTARLVSPGTASSTAPGSELNASIPGPVAIHNGSIYAGATAGNSSAPNALLRYDQTGNGWTPGALVPITGGDGAPFINAIAFAGNTMFLSRYSYYGNGNVEVYTLQSGTWVFTTRLGTPGSGVPAIAVSPDQTLLAITNNNASAITIITLSTHASTTLTSPIPLVDAHVAFTTRNDLAISDGGAQSTCPNYACSGHIAIFSHSIAGQADSWDTPQVVDPAVGTYSYGLGLAAMGKAVLVSAENSNGTSRIDAFEKGATGTWVVTNVMADPSGQPFNGFGPMVTDGATLLISSNSSNINAGDAGTIYAYRYAVPPAAPVVQSAVGWDHSATVTWLKPASDGGSPILGYTVTAVPGGQTCSTNSPDLLSCTIYGLTNGLNYTFTVTARNLVGVSAPPVQAPPPTTLIVGTPPSQVVVLAPVRVPGDGTQVTISWLAASSDPNLPIIGYLATATPGGATCSTTGALSCTITGLIPGQDYSFTVSAINGIGSGTTGPGVLLPGDTTPPVVVGAPDRAPNPNGWYNAQVTLHWTATDPDNPASSLSSTPDTIVNTQGASQTITSGQVCDQARNCATGQATVSIDTTGPTVTINGVIEGRKYLMSAPPSPTCVASDALSGLTGACRITVVGGNANHVGAFTATATATDKAGNTTTAISRYKVIYGWNGFDQPINDTAHQTGLTTSVFKAGSTVPAQFALTDGAGQIVQPVSAPVWLTPVQGVATTLAVDETIYSLPADSGSAYKAVGTRWKYNYNTANAQAGYYWRIGVGLDDGETYFVNLALR